MNKRNDDKFLDELTVDVSDDVEPEAMTFDEIDAIINSVEEKKK